MGKPLTKRQIVFALLGVFSVSGFLYLQAAQSKPPRTTSMIISPVQSVISLDEFNAIQTGMTYDQVVEIVGSQGTLQSQAEIAGAKSEMYFWIFLQNPGGSNANIQLSNGKVIGKAQFMLQ